MGLFSQASQEMLASIAHILNSQAQNNSGCSRRKRRQWVDVAKGGRWGGMVWNVAVQGTLCFQQRSGEESPRTPVAALLNKTALAQIVRQVPALFLAMQKVSSNNTKESNSQMEGGQHLHWCCLWHLHLTPSRALVGTWIQQVEET